MNLSLSTATSLSAEASFLTTSAMPELTLDRTVSVEGVGLHSGVRARVTLSPHTEPGWTFVRSDLGPQARIPVSPGCVTSTTHATTLAKDGASVSTIEHLLAALWARGISRCRIEVDGPEAPILDGSSEPWCRALDEAGERRLDGVRPTYALSEPVCVFKGEGCVLGLPHPVLRASVSVAFDTLWNSGQSFDGDVGAGWFSREVAPARTFTLAEWIEPLRAAGLIKGGSPDNALVLDDSGPSLPWRLPNELARHKLLDLIGDAALLFGSNGGALRAHLIAIKAGHELHRQWAQECLRRNALVRLDQPSLTQADA
jgi:UDP-3-O-[3-hydroxymyristoyl] N-acetylglucosamine deacetylase